MQRGNREIFNHYRNRKLRLAGRPPDSRPQKPGAGNQSGSASSGMGVSDYVPAQQRQFEQALLADPNLVEETLGKPAPKSNGIVARPAWTDVFTISADWSEPEQLGNDLLPVPGFDGAMLPEAFRDHVVDVSERMQVPIDLPAASAVACLAGAVNGRALIQPKYADSQWLVTPNLWSAIIMPPARLKSPVLGAYVDPLSRIEAEWRRQHESEMVSYAQWEREQKLREQAWAEQFKSATKKGDRPPAYSNETREKPVLRRLIANDPTYEAMQSILADNPMGVLLVRDELSGWLAILNKPGREGERQFFLESWSGDKAYTVDRVGRGSVHAPRLCISIIGGIQPGRLRQYLSDAVKGGPGDDGLFQRFQLIVWPDFQKEWTLIDRPPNHEAADRVAQVYSRLAELSSDQPTLFRFADDAQQLFFVWLSELERKIRAGDLHPAFEAHLGKYRSLMPSLALLFELADRTDLNGEKVVSLDHARQAAAWCTYLEAHAQRIYGCLVSPELHAARELAGKITKGKLTGEFSTRDVYLKGWSGLSTPDEVRAALRLLEDAGWIRQAAVEKPGGRPPERWRVNPKVKGEGQ